MAGGPSERGNFSRFGGGFVFRWTNKKPRKLSFPVALLCTLSTLEETTFPFPHSFSTSSCHILLSDMHFFSLTNWAAVFRRKTSKNSKPSLKKSSSVRFLTAEEFKMVKLIGRGGFGEVCACPLGGGFIGFILIFSKGVFGGESW